MPLMSAGITHKSSGLQQARRQPFFRTLKVIAGSAIQAGKSDTAQWPYDILGQR